MNNPLVSVIVPCYNHGEYLSEAIDSALAQSHKNIEVIVINDGSTDNTETVISSYGDRISGVNIKENKGLSYARNLGLRACKSSFISFLDADDVMLPSKIESQISAVFRENADCVLCRYRYSVQTRKGLKDVAEGGYSWPPGDILAYVIRKAFISCIPLYRKHVLDNVGGFNPKFRHRVDTELTFRLAIQGIRLAYVNKVLYKIRLHSGQRLTHDLMASYEAQLRLAHFLIRELENNNLWNEARRAAVADYCYETGRWLQRHGRMKVGGTAFELAEMVFPSFQPHSGGVVYKALAKTIGLSGAEFIRLVFKRALRKSVS